jgi:hypothetical protein
MTAPRIRTMKTTVKISPTKNKPRKGWTSVYYVNQPEGLVLIKSGYERIVYSSESAIATHARKPRENLNTDSGTSATDFIQRRKVPRLPIQ